MKVKVHPPDEGGCAFYRIHEPARIAIREGVEVETNAMLPVEQAARTGERFPMPVDADVLVFQRPAKLSVVELIPKYQALGYAVVVDIDDDFAALPPTHPAFHYFLRNPEVNGRHLLRACELADMVTVTTPALAERYGAHGRVMILPNRVPAALLELQREESLNFLVGWAGNGPYHPEDLEVTHGSVARALENSPWQFLHVGPDSEESAEVFEEQMKSAPEFFTRENVPRLVRAADIGRRLGFTEPVRTTGGLSIERYHAALGLLDVGIVPLADSRFNAAKSALKGLEYAARGVAFVASDTPEYHRLAEEGIGVTAAARGKGWGWRDALLPILRDESLRVTMADEAKQAVAEHHTYETEGYAWVDAWEDALKNRRARTSVSRHNHQPMGAEPPKVTILMTVYNAAKYLQRAIDSVLEQTYEEWELLIIDDNSSDPAVEMILKAVDDPFRRIKIAKFETTQAEREATCRYATLINWGSTMTEAPYMTYLAGDDYYALDRLERMVPMMATNEVIYGTQGMLKADGTPFAMRPAVDVLDDAFERVDLNSVMHTRDAFELVDGWDDSAEIWRTADAHFWRRLTDHGYKFVPVPGAPTDFKHYRDDGVDERVKAGVTPWVEGEAA